MNEQNLKPFTVSQAREFGAKGGRASAKAKKERAIVSSLYAKTLSKKIKVKIDGVDTAMLGEQVLARRIQKIYVNGSDRDVIALAKEVREALEGSKVQFSGAIVETDYRDLTDEQRAALRAANETLLEAGL